MADHVLFLAVCRSVKDVKNAFMKYDRNGDGAIDRGELYTALTNYRLNFSDQVQSSEYGSVLQSLENTLGHR
jgi:Ca2+-binding EF-hand superfamily protein